MKFKVMTIHHAPEGEYCGTIREANLSSDGKYFWFVIDVEDLKRKLNISIPVNHPLFINFAQDYIDDNGELETDDFIDSFIKFSVIDKEINGNVYSKFSALESIFEDEEEEK